MCCQIAESRWTPIDLFGMQTTFGSFDNRQVQAASDSWLRLVKCTWSLESLHAISMSMTRLLLIEVLCLLAT